MTPSVAPVLVVGGGPSGLVTGLALLQNGVPVRIIDKEPHYPITQRSHAVWPRTFEVFHSLRAHEMSQRAMPVPPIQDHKPGSVEPLNKTFQIFNRADPTPSIPYMDPMSIGQPAVEGILRSHLEKFGCFVELGTELQSFEDDGERVFAKIVQMKSGKGTVETFEASYLIGADGAKGVTRKQLGLTFLGETRDDFSTVVGDICLEIEGIDRNHWHFFGDRSSDFISLRPTNEIASDGFHFMMTLKAYEPETLISDENLMIECMSKLIGSKIQLKKIVALYLFRPNIRMVDKFGHGRAFVVGDAAHVHSPTGGQGLNSSVQDAFNLAWKVSLVYKGLSPTTLLDTYTTERLPVITEMLNITTDLLNKLRKATTTESVLKPNDRLKMLGVNYRMSPIVVDEFTETEPVNAYGTLDESTLIAGDRAPDAPGLVVVGDDTETRLFDVFSPTYHTVLWFTPDASTALGVFEILKDYPKDATRTLVVVPQGTENTTVLERVDIVVDHSGHAYRGYLVVKGEQKVVVVRPDGVVGAIVHGAEGLRTYFDKIFVKG